MLAIAGMAIMVVLPLGLEKLIVGKIAKHRFESEVRRLRDSGQPVLLDDFQPAGSDAPTNPVPKWRAAFHTIVGSPAKDPFSARVPFTEQTNEELDKYVKQNRAALALASQAAALKGPADWGIRFQVPPINTPYPDLNEQREVATLICAAVTDAHRRADDRSAVDLLRVGIADRNAMLRHPTIVGHLVALGLGELVTVELRAVTPDLQIAPHSVGRAAPADQVKRLIAELLDDSATDAGERYGWLTERACTTENLMDAFAGDERLSHKGGSPPSAFLRFWRQGLIYDGGTAALELETKCLNASERSSWAACQAAMAAGPDPAREKGPVSEVLSGKLTSSNRSLHARYREMTERRMAVVALALRWYETEHAGRLPATLDELLPRYLPRIPADPMAAGAPLHYRAGPDPIIYSVGENGKDDGGSEKSGDPETEWWNKDDAVLHLRPQPPTTQPGLQ